MATYTKLQNGSRGEDVRNLQNALNAAGYKLNPDAIFGDKTEAAVRDYQSKNGLTIDGIAGNQTLGKLYGTSPTTKIAATPVSQASTSSTTKKTPTQAQYDPTAVMKGVSQGTAQQLKQYAQGYQSTPAVDQALKMLQQQQKNKPADYVSQWSEQIGAMWQQINNRDPYSYDFTTDPTYLQYRDRYMSQGRTAMQDASAQAASLTGGYGNSYAQQVGQQTYNAYLQQLNDIVPQLEQQNYQRWRDEYSDLVDRYQLAMQAENQDYGRYRDTVSDWQTDRSYLTDRYDTERQFGYNQWADMLSYYQQAAAQEQDQANWQKQFDYQVEQDRIAQQQAAAAQKSASRTSGSSSSKKSSSRSPSYNPAPANDTPKPSSNYTSQLSYYKNWKNSGGSGNAIMNAINKDGLLSPDEKADMIIALGLQEVDDRDFYQRYLDSQKKTSTTSTTSTPVKSTKGAVSKSQADKQKQLKH